MAQTLIFSALVLLQLTQLVLADPSQTVPEAVLNTTRSFNCRPADCPSGYLLKPLDPTRKAFIFHRSEDNYAKRSKVANCPSGYTNMGLTCYRGPYSYTKCCTTIASKCGCRSGYTDMGCHCQRWASTLTSGHMSCDSGYSLNTATARCYETCRPGYSSREGHCHRPESTRGYTCKAGEFRTYLGTCCKYNKSS